MLSFSQHCGKEGSEPSHLLSSNIRRMEKCRIAGQMGSSEVIVPRRSRSVWLFVLSRPNRLDGSRGSAAQVRRPANGISTTWCLWQCTALLLFVLPRSSAPEGRIVELLTSAPTMSLPRSPRVRFLLLLLLRRGLLLASVVRLRRLRWRRLLLDRWLQLRRFRWLERRRSCGLRSWWRAWRRVLATSGRLSHCRARHVWSFRGTGRVVC